MKIYTVFFNDFEISTIIKKYLSETNCNNVIIKNNNTF